jgi:poly-gamma-glutamate synthesis protein (capsule biosynthesis protein)
MAFAGDLLPHGPVNAAAAQAGRATGQAYDYGPMLAPLRPILSATDLAICHLEVPVAPTPAQVSTYPTFGSPPEIVAGAKSAGYKGCDTVSNHSLDKGAAGIKATLDAFDLEGLGHAGSARSADEARHILVYDVRGVKVAHLAYTYGFNGYRPPDEPWLANKIDPAQILADARRARQAGADLVVVSLHWGTDGMVAPDSLQRRLAPELAASPDIDLIVGCHAHRVQEVRKIHGKFVVFGMGNELSNQHLDLEHDGLLVRATATRAADGRWSVTGLQAIPTWMDTTDWKVLPVTETLASGSAPSPLVAAALRASYERTVAAITSAGPVSGMTVDPLPK